MREATHQNPSPYHVDAVSAIDAQGKLFRICLSNTKQNLGSIQRCSCLSAKKLLASLDSTYILDHHRKVFRECYSPYSEGTLPIFIEPRAISKTRLANDGSSQSKLLKYCRLTAAKILPLAIG